MAELETQNLGDGPFSSLNGSRGGEDAAKWRWTTSVSAKATGTSRVLTQG